MRKRNAKVGDVFLVKTDFHTKRYFQYICNDLTQLNSDVIRAFTRTYSVEENPSIHEIVSEDILLFAHCTVRLGLKMELWEKVGNIGEVGDFSDIIFRNTNDYGAKVNEERILKSKNWHIWRINDKNFTPVPKLQKEHRNGYIGIVFNPLGIVEILKGNKYPPNYPDIDESILA